MNWREHHFYNEFVTNKELYCIFVIDWCLLLSYKFRATPFISLFLFFVSSSILTKKGEKEKAKVDSEFKTGMKGRKKSSIIIIFLKILFIYSFLGGQRNYIQVFCNGGPQTVLCILYILTVGFNEVKLDFINSPWSSSLLVGIMGLYFILIIVIIIINLLKIHLFFSPCTLLIHLLEHLFIYLFLLKKNYHKILLYFPDTTFLTLIVAMLVQMEILGLLNMESYHKEKSYLSPHYDKYFFILLRNK